MEYNFYSEKFEFDDESPFYGTHDDFEETFEIIHNCIEEIEKSNNIRDIVIETWLIIDYFIRNAMGQLLNLKKIGTEQYDLRYKILPISFEQCLDIFYNTLEIQRNLPRDPDDHAIKLPAKFCRYMMKEHEEFYDELITIIDLYYEKHHPSLLKKNEEREDIDSLFSNIKNPSVKQNYVYNVMWVEAYKIIDENWIKKARRINKTRNQAAHSYDRNKVLKSLGYSGENAFEYAKEECLEIVETLLKIKKSR